MTGGTNVEDSAIDLEIAMQYGHFRNASKTSNFYSCAVDCFLEICYRLFLPTMKSNGTSLSLNSFFTFLEACGSMTSRRISYLSLTENIFQLLDKIREPIWEKIIENCPTFRNRDCNAESFEIFSGPLFQNLSTQEKNYFESRLTVRGDCNTCSSEQVKQIESTLIYVSEIMYPEISSNLNSWPKCFDYHFNRTLTCGNCQKDVTSNISYDLKLPTFMLFEFVTPFILHQCSFHEQITIQQTHYKLTALLRNSGSHFACGLFLGEKWLYIDDLYPNRLQYNSLDEMYSDKVNGWYFGVYTKISAQNIENSYEQSSSSDASLKQRKTKIGQLRKEYMLRKRGTVTYAGLESEKIKKRQKIDIDFTVIDRKVKENIKKNKRDKHNSQKKDKYQNNKEKINAQRRRNYKGKSQAKQKEMLFNKSSSQTFFENDSMKKFNESINLEIIQCSICFEAWPLKKKTSKVENVYLCTRCKRDKGTPKKFSVENNMKPSPIPKPLQGLTQIEEMLIARAFPVMQVYTRPRGGQRSYKGHVLNLPNNVQKIADSLPRDLKDIPVVVFKLKGKDNKSQELKVRRQKIYDALLWLTGTNEKGDSNNFLYKNITIDMSRLSSLPKDDFLDVSELEVNSNERFDSDDESNNDITVPDLGPIGDNEDCVYDKSSEMGSFIPTKANVSKESDSIREAVLNPIVNELDISNTPLNEFCTPFLASLAFPTLFPDTKGDPTNPAMLRNIAKSDTESLNEKLKHLIRFAEKKDEKWVYRFASHPRFAFWGFNMLYRKRLISQGNFFVKQNPGEANLTIEELQEMAANIDYDLLMKKLMRYSKNVSGTNAYWADVKEKLKATIVQMGTPTIFWTLSMADFHWPDIHDIFHNDENSNENNIRQNIINNPHIVDWLFTERVKSFVKYWLYESLDADWHWYRFEYALMRGSIHCHGLAKLKNDPGICELTEIALKGFHASIQTEQISDNNENGDLEALNRDILNGKKAEDEICNYVDTLMTAVNPICGPIDEWVKPHVHPCKKLLSEITAEDFDNDYVDLANSVQRHTKCSSAYCLRKKGEEQVCRFKFPFDCAEKTHLIFEKKRLKSGEDKYIPTIVLKRNDPRMNRHQRLQLQSWRANCDIQIILDHNACLNYIAKYASKSEKISDVARDTFISVIQNLSGSESAQNVFRKLMIKSAGERDFSAQEVMHYILSLNLYSSSFPVVNCSLDGSRQINIEDNEVKTKNSILDDYATRYEKGTDEMKESNLIDFISTWYKGKKNFEKRKVKVIVRTFPNYSGNPKTPCYPQFCKYQMIKYKPWKDTVDNLWNGLPATNETYCLKWKEFINSVYGQTYVPNWRMHLLNANSQDFVLEQEDESENELECQNHLHEDWMYVANFSSRVVSTTTDNDDYWREIRDKYFSQQINEIPFWIETNRNLHSAACIDYSQFRVSDLNEEQMMGYDIVKNHFEGRNEQQLLMIITGLAGSGKSYLINCIKCLLGNFCILSAFFGIAAFNISGKTLHSIFQLPIGNRLRHELKGNALIKLQTELSQIKYVIIDEFSVIGQNMLGWIDSRCRQATGLKDKLFGGISIILVGDVAQLPPVMDNVLFYSHPVTEITVAGYMAYSSFDKVVQLKVNMRSSGDHSNQKKFREALWNIRNGKFTVEDWKLFLSRQPERFSFDCHNLVKLAFSNKTVAEHNLGLLESLGEPIAEIHAKNNTSAAAKLSSDEFGGLESKLYLCKGARVMLTRNLWPDTGLCNGSLGVVKDIIFEQDQLPPSLPTAIIVKFDKYSGPSFFQGEEKCVPIVPIVSTSTDNDITHERTQLPLKLAWSITIHKSQGLTLDKVLVDIGQKESFDGLSYVALSRVKNIDDMMVESFPFERLSRLKESKSLKYRMQEEKRLQRLAEVTYCNN